MLLVEVNCIFRFTVLRMERSNCFEKKIPSANCFDIINWLNKLKITVTIAFAKLPDNIFKACLNLMC